MPSHVEIRELIWFSEYIRLYATDLKQ